MSDKSNLGDLGRGYDDVDIFGLNEFGEPEGMGAMWGALVGVGAGTLAAIGGRAFGTMTVFNSELLGLGAGVAAGGIMAAFKGTRHAGWTAMASALLGNGLRAIEAKMATPATYFTGVSLQPLPRFTPGMNGAMGIVQAQPLNGGKRMHMSGLGNTAKTLQLMGGPKISAIAGKWGHSAVTQTG